MKYAMGKRIRMNVNPVAGFLSLLCQHPVIFHTLIWSFNAMRQINEMRLTQWQCD